MSTPADEMNNSGTLGSSSSADPGDVGPPQQQQEGNLMRAQMEPVRSQGVVRAARFAPQSQSPSVSASAQGSLSLASVQATVFATVAEINALIAQLENTSRFLRYRFNPSDTTNSNLADSCYQMREVQMNLRNTMTSLGIPMPGVVPYNPRRPVSPPYEFTEFPYPTAYTMNTSSYQPRYGYQFTAPNNMDTIRQRFREMHGNMEALPPYTPPAYSPYSHTSPASASATVNVNENEDSDPNVNEEDLQFQYDSDEDED